MRRVVPILFLGIILGTTCGVPATAQKKDAAEHHIPLSALHTIRLVQDEETGETKIEIRLIGKDRKP